MADDLDLRAKDPIGGPDEVFESVRRSVRAAIRATASSGGDLAGAVHGIFEAVARGPLGCRAAAVLGMLDAASELGGPVFARVRAAVAATIVPARPRKDGGHAVLPLATRRRLPRR